MVAIVLEEGVTLTTEIIAVVTSEQARHFYTECAVLLVSIVVTAYWMVLNAVRWVKAQWPSIALTICTFMVAVTLQYQVMGNRVSARVGRELNRIVGGGDDALWEVK